MLGPALARTATVVLLGILGSFVPLTAYGQFDPVYCGHSVFCGWPNWPGPAPSADGTVSFAVYKTSDNDWTDDWASTYSIPGSNFTGATGAVDADAKYVFFFQFVNNNPAGGANDPLDNLDVPIAGHLVTSIGNMPGYTFNDPAGGGVNSSNVGLGTYFGKAVSLVTFVDMNSTSPFAANASAIDMQDASAGTDFTDMKWDEVPADQFTSVSFFTTNAIPVGFSLGMLGGYGSSLGSLPTAILIPEPLSLVMILGSLPFCALGFFTHWRRRRNNRPSSDD